MAFHTNPEPVPASAIYSLNLQMKHLPINYFLSRSTKVVTSEMWRAAKMELESFRALQRIEIFKEGNIWSQRQLCSTQKNNKKGIWPNLLREMQDMSLDFRQERRWKAKLCFTLASNVAAKNQGTKRKIIECFYADDIKFELKSNNENDQEPLQPDCSSEASHFVSLMKEPLENQPSFDLNEPEESVIDTGPCFMQKWRPDEDNLLSKLLQVHQTNWNIIVDNFNVIFGLFGTARTLDEIKWRAEKSKYSMWQNASKLNHDFWVILTSKKYESHLALFDLMKRANSKMNVTKQNEQQKISLNSHPSHEAVAKKAGTVSKSTTPEELALRRFQRMRHVPEMNSANLLRYSMHGRGMVQTPRNATSQGNPNIVVQQKAEHATTLQTESQPRSQSKVMQAIQQLANNSRLSPRQLSELTAAKLTTFETKKTE